MGTDVSPSFSLSLSLSLSVSLWKESGSVTRCCLVGRRALVLNIAAATLSIGYFMPCRSVVYDVNLKLFTSSSHRIAAACLCTVSLSLSLSVYRTHFVCSIEQKLLFAFAGWQQQQQQRRQWNSF